MSYIRNDEPRTYFDGVSNVYLYPMAGTGRDSGSNVGGHTAEMTETDLSEVALRIIERTDLDEDTFEEVVDAMTNYYPEYTERVGEENDT